VWHIVAIQHGFIQCFGRIDRPECRNKTAKRNARIAEEVMAKVPGRQIRRLALLFVAQFILATGSCFAQFSAGVQGNVLDSTGAVIPNATLTLVNMATQVAQTTTSDANGIYRFVSLPPGDYTVKATKDGFEPGEVPFNLGTGELRDVRIALHVGSTSATVQVSAEAPLLDTSDSRFAMTLNSEQLESLPNGALSPLAALDLAPGVTGTAGAPDNFEQENYLSFGAHGRGENGDLAVLDGMSVNSNIRGGVINTTPNLDSVQEIAVQTDTYSVDYGSATSIQIAMTTKSGDSQYHGSGSEYYQYEKLNARGYYGPPHPEAIPAYHISNMSFTVGGPVIPHKQLFFFAAYEPYRNIASNAGGYTWVTTTNATLGDTSGGITGQTQGFTEFLAQANSASPEVQMMMASNNLPSSKFKPAAPVDTITYNTAAEDFNGGSCPASGNLGPQYLNVPCNFVINQAGFFNSVNKDSNAQFSARVDKVFSKDRIYGSLFRSTIANNSVNVIPSNTTLNPSWTWALQGDETHTFSARFLNEATVGYSRLQGEAGEGDYDLPHVGVPGGDTGWGAAEGYNWIQHSQRYRDTLTYIRGAHSFKAGAEAWHGDDIALFAAVGGIPTFYYNNPSDFANNLTDYEGGLYYNYQTGQPQPWQYDYNSTTFGIFAEDSWKATPRLTLNYGIRYDNFGNPYPTTVNGGKTTQSYLSNFILPTTGSFQERIENAALAQVNHVFNHDMNWIFSPRAGFAYNLRGDDKWVLRGGFGMYRELFTLGNAENGLRDNPPGFLVPTFTRGVTASAPIFSLGTSMTYPFGYVYPQSAAGTPPDALGGFPGQYESAGGVARNLSPPTTMNWSLGVERQLLKNLTASIGYEGSHSYDQIYGAGETWHQGDTNYGVDVNVFDGDTIQNPNFNGGLWYQGIQTRLNTSFGEIGYAFNGARGNYYAIIMEVRGSFGKHGFLNASYTHSRAMDDWQDIGNDYQPNGSWNTNPQYGPASLDVPNRVSAAASYELPGLSKGNGVLRRALSGYQLSSTVRLQSGGPLTIVNWGGLSLIDTNPGVSLTQANYQSELAAGNVTFISPANINSENAQAVIQNGTSANSWISGDFSGDGNGLGLPNVLSYHQNRKKSAARYKCNVSQSGCPSSFNISQFAYPAFNPAGAQGNEKIDGFRDLGWEDIDLSLIKNTRINERINLQLRFDAFDAFNHVNWNGLDTSLADFATTFGTTNTPSNSRTAQLGAKVAF
jgi:hypothetical protein